MSEQTESGDIPIPRRVTHPVDYENPIYVEFWSIDGTAWEVLVDKQGEPIASSGTFYKWRTVWVRWTLTHKANRINNVAQVKIDPRAVAWKRRRPGPYTLHGSAAKGETDG